MEVCAGADYLELLLNPVKENSVPLQYLAPPLWDVPLVEVGIGWKPVVIVHYNLSKELTLQWMNIRWDGEVNEKGRSKVREEVDDGREDEVPSDLDVADVVIGW